MSDEYPAVIVCTPGVLGGRPRVAGTRIDVQAIQFAVQWHSVEECLHMFPALTRAQVEAALAYAAARPALAAEWELDALVAEAFCWDDLRDNPRFWALIALAGGQPPREE